MAGPNPLILSPYILLLVAKVAGSASTNIPRDGGSQTQQGPTVTAVDPADGSLPNTDSAAPQTSSESKHIIPGWSDSSSVVLLVILGAVVLLAPMFLFIWLRRQRIRRAQRIKRMKSRMELAHRKGSSTTMDTGIEGGKQQTRLATGKPLPALKEEDA